MDFKAYLEYFGRIEATPDTVSRWRNEPPRLVMRYLEERKENIEFLKETGERLKRFVK